MSEISLSSTIEAFDKGVSGAPCLHLMEIIEIDHIDKVAIALQLKRWIFYDYKYKYSYRFRYCFQTPIKFEYLKEGLLVRVCI